MQLLFADTVPFNPTTDMSIERIYDGTSSLAAQNPSGLDVGMNIQFGAVQGTASDDIQTLAQGSDTEASILQINKAGMYRLQTQAALGRNAGSGTSVLNLRVLFNGFQAGRTIQYRLANINFTYDFILEAWLELSAGVQISYELARDSNGVNDGGLIGGVVNTPGWASTTSAALRVERFIRV